MAGFQSRAFALRRETDSTWPEVSATLLSSDAEAFSTLTSSGADDAEAEPDVFEVEPFFLVQGQHNVTPILFCLTGLTLLTRRRELFFRFFPASTAAALGTASRRRGSRLHDKSKGPHCRILFLLLILKLADMVVVQWFH